MDTISQEPDPFVRGKLYLELGNSGDKKVLAELLDYLENETDSQARLQALAAAAKLGNEKEGQAFIEAASSVSPDDIMQAQELLLYIAKPSMAKALSSWLDSF